MSGIVCSLVCFDGNFLIILALREVKLAADWVAAGVLGGCIDHGWESCSLLDGGWSIHVIDVLVSFEFLTRLRKLEFFESCEWFLGEEIASKRKSERRLSLLVFGGRLGVGVPWLAGRRCASISCVGHFTFH